MSKAKAKGTTAEREVVRYLQNWWPAAERRALSGNKDRGDVAGIPDTVIEVKAAARQELAKWRRETWTEMENAGANHCVLVVKRPYKPVGQWDAYFPQTLLPGVLAEINEESEAESWLRMDLRLAVAMIETIERLWSPSSQS